MKLTSLIFYAGMFLLGVLADKRADDLIVNLPGLTYNVPFKQYAGYLIASPGNYLHYWFVESQSNPQTDPLLLWLTGGPGCSSLGAFLTELGPFLVNPDNATVFENVYAWNKKANVLFLESPRGVGFSYQNYTINSDNVFDDNRTAWDSFLALRGFLDAFPEHKAPQPLFVTGESYGGVYVPTLTRLLIDRIQAKQLDANLIGMSVGNGELSEYLQINSAVDFLYFHGMYGKDEWDALKSCCPQTSLAYCNFSQYITLGDDGTAYSINNSYCGNLTVQLGFWRVWLTLNDVYNLYQDCYQTTAQSLGSKMMHRYRRSINQEDFGQFVVNANFVDQGSRINYFSTDAQGGFQCYMGRGATAFLNQPSVRTALHVPDSLPPWQSCSDYINGNYTQQHHDMTSVFDDIINSGYTLRILIYNGDADTACNFLGDEWFVEALRTKYNMSTTKRHPWFFNLGAQYKEQTAGYRKSFSYKTINIDLVTVKGAGHFVPTDRPGPALQMITNFINNNANYSQPTGYSIERQPLLPAYKTPTTSCPSAAAQIGSISTICALLIAALGCAFSNDA